MSTLLSIDPGIRGVGAALWEHGYLIAAAYVKNRAATGGGPREAAMMAHSLVEWTLSQWSNASSRTLDELVLEMPQTYGGRSAKGDTNDLLSLAAVDGAIAAVYAGAKISSYVPKEWKGSIVKPKKPDGKEPYVIETRVRDKLKPHELAQVQWPTAVKSTQEAIKHNWDVADAIGVGMKSLNRFERVRIFARD